MQQRLDFFATEPALMKAVLALNHAAETSGLEKSLVHLVKLRASQINGCSYCVDMHSREARKDGDTEQRVFLVSAWRESPLFSDRERAAFEWTERLTRLSEGPVWDDLYASTTAHFSAEEMVRLTVLVGMINIWNRLCVSFHAIHPMPNAKAA